MKVVLLRSYGYCIIQDVLNKIGINYEIIDKAEDRSLPTDVLGEILKDKLYSVRPDIIIMESHSIGFMNILTEYKRNTGCKFLFIDHGPIPNTRSSVLNISGRTKSEKDSFLLYDYIFIYNEYQYKNYTEDLKVDKSKLVKSSFINYSPRYEVVPNKVFIYVNNLRWGYTRRCSYIKLGYTDVNKVLDKLESLGYNVNVGKAVTYEKRFKNSVNPNEFMDELRNSEYVIILGGFSSTMYHLLEGQKLLVEARAMDIRTPDLKVIRNNKYRSSIHRLESLHSELINSTNIYSSIDELLYLITNKMNELKSTDYSGIIKSYPYDFKITLLDLLDKLEDNYEDYDSI